MFEPYQAGPPAMAFMCAYQVVVEDSIEPSSGLPRGRVHWFGLKMSSGFPVLASSFTCKCSSLAGRCSPEVTSHLLCSSAVLPCTHLQIHIPQQSTVPYSCEHADSQARFSDGVPTSLGRCLPAQNPHTLALGPQALFDGVQASAPSPYLLSKR